MERLLKQLGQNPENSISHHSENSDAIQDFVEDKNSFIPETLLIGKLNQKIPALIPFGNCNGIFLKLDENKIREGYLFIQDLILQTIYKMPSQYSQLTVWNNGKLGRNLSLIKEIENSKIQTQFLINTPDNISNFLTDLEIIIKKRNKLLGYKYQNIAEYNTDKLENNSYHLYLLSEFPENWNSDNLIFFERLLPQCQAVGIYFFIVSRQDIPEKMLENFILIFKDVDKFTVKNIEKEEILNTKFDLKLLHIDLESNFERIDKILASLKF